ncbi:hypothetical protein LAZ67_6003336, partial [Cordylochernes scorpioides]
MPNKAFPNDPSKRTTVFEWHSRFKAGRISIEDDPQHDTGISKTTIGRIVTKDLKLKKTPVKFIPRFLTNEQKLCRLATCENMLEMTRTDPEWKDKIITGDETWVYGYDPETKRQYADWRGQGKPRPKKSRILKPRNKVLLVTFLDNKGIVHHEYLPAGQTVIKEMYLGILRRLREAIRKKKRSEKWSNGDWILHHNNARPHTEHLIAGQIPAAICHHVAVPDILISLFDHFYVLMELLALFITICTEIIREFVQSWTASALVVTRSAVEAGDRSLGAPIGVVAVATAAVADADRLLVVQDHLVHNDPAASSNGLVGSQVQLNEGRAGAISGRRSVCHSDRLVSRKLAEGIGGEESLDNVLIRGFRFHVEEADSWEELPQFPDFQALELVVQGRADGRNDLCSAGAQHQFSPGAQRRPDALGQSVGSADSFEDVPWVSLRVICNNHDVGRRFLPIEGGFGNGRLGGAGRCRLAGTSGLVLLAGGFDASDCFLLVRAGSGFLGAGAATGTAAGAEMAGLMSSVGQELQPLPESLPDHYQEFQRELEAIELRQRLGVDSNSTARQSSFKLATVSVNCDVEEGAIFLNDLEAKSF